MQPLSFRHDNGNCRARPTSPQLRAAENLHRAELTALERAEHVAEWVRLTEANQVSDNLSETRPKGGRPGGAAAASRELGIGERDVQRAVKVASLSDDAKEAARQVGLDSNRSALLKAAAAPRETQAERHRHMLWQWSGRT